MVNAHVSRIGLGMIALYINHIHILVMQNAWGPAQDLPRMTASHAYNMPARTIRVSVSVIKDGKERIALISKAVDALQNVVIALVQVLMSV